MNAQQFNNWIFHNYNGITFNTAPITFLAGGQITNTISSYSTASISDNNGQLLFYSDGERVWNRNNVLMPNGLGLSGGYGQINTALIIPFINDTGKYYLFTAQGLSNSPLSDTNKYAYSIIDMQLNGGLGDVVNKNTFIKFFAIEKMVALPNANGNDIWWIGRDWTDNFYSYKINCSGFQNSNPVISTVGDNTNNNINILNGGEIKASPDSKIIAACYFDYFEIYQFNNVTGVMSNPIKIPTPDGCYGVEFSPNSNLLYVTGYDTFFGFIKQYNLSTYDSIAISNSAINLNSFYYGGGLQLGPDNKIYNNPGGKIIQAINNPNVPGTGCNFQDSVIVLPNDAFRRFPYSYVNLITAQNVQISYTIAPNCRTVTFTGKTYIKGNNLTFKWKWGEPPPVAGTPLDSTTQVVPSLGDTTYTTIVHTYPPGQDTFFVNLAVSSDTLCGIGRAGIKVILPPALPKPAANFGYAASCGNLTVAFTDSSLLNTNPGISYQYAFKPAIAPPTAYSNFSQMPNPAYTFAVFDSFDVRLIVKGTTGCARADTLVKRIVFTGVPNASFTANNTCAGKPVSITNSSNNPGTVTYLWTGSEGQTSNGTEPVNFVFNSGGSKTIRLKVTAQNGCASSITKIITVFTAPTAAFDIIEACLGRPLVINNNSTGPIISYAWQTSNAQQSSAIIPQFLFDTAGNYSVRLEVATANNCSTSLTKTTPIQPVVLITSPGIDINVNANQPLQLNITGAATYSWQPFTNLTNANSSSPVFKSAVTGIFPLTVNATSAQGCKTSESLTIKVFDGGDYLLVPNAFTPNGDTKNDKLNFTCSGLQTLTFFRMYNRYGQIVYQQNNCGNTGWDGSFGGKAQPGGAYIYNWQGIAFNGQTVSGSGSVILVR